MSSTLHESELFVGGPVWGGLHRVGPDVAAHTHDFLEIAVIGPGTGRHEGSDGDRPLRHGNVVVLRPGAWHRFHGCAGLVVANCCISAQAMRGELAMLYDVPMFRRLLWSDPVAPGAYGVVLADVGADAADEAITRITDLVADLDAGRTRPGRMLGHLITVLGILADASEPVGLAASGVHPAVAATLRRLEAAPAEPWRIDVLARAVSLDPAYLGRLFTRHVGLSPMRYLARVRAERAATLLAHSDLPATRIGAAVGWGDPTYFARRFRDLLGITPSEYRSRSRTGGRS